MQERAVLLAVEAGSCDGGGCGGGAAGASGDGHEAFAGEPPRLGAIGGRAGRWRRHAFRGVLGATAAAAAAALALARLGPARRPPRGAAASSAEVSQAWRAGHRHGPRDQEGFCRASAGGGLCVLDAARVRNGTVKVSLFGNSYSGFYYETDHDLKDVVERLELDPGSAAGLSQEEQRPKFSMHTLFDSGLFHHKDTFRDIIAAEDPDYVVLQDGSLNAMGVQGGTSKDGSHFFNSLQVRRTAEAMELDFGPAAWDWAQRPRRRSGAKPVILLVAPWPRPEEAFVRAQEGSPAELEGVVEGSWGMKNYEVYSSGVSTNLHATHFIGVHGEAEMLEATLDGLAIYRERLLRGAARRAGREDGHAFRRDCPFEVVLVPVGVAFHHARTRVEDIFSPRPTAASRSKKRLDVSAFVKLPQRLQHPPPTQAERKSLPGAQERNFLFTDVQKYMPWFGHPTPMGTHFYAAVLKRTLLAVMQGKNGRDFGAVRVAWDRGHLQRIRNVLVEETNHLDLEGLNKWWHHRTVHACAKNRKLCPGDQDHEDTGFDIMHPETWLFAPILGLRR